MIIVTGSVKVRPDRFDDALAASLEHVRRSRAEPGCISHTVRQDVEDPMTLVFFEEWESDAALDTHFAVPESGAFVRVLAECASERPSMTIYDASRRF